MKILVATALCLAACTQGSAPETPARSGEGKSVVLVVVESLRADRLASGATPFLDELGATSVVFERAYAASSYAPQTLTSLWTGRLPTSAGAIGIAESQPSPELDTLPLALRRAGYGTGLVSSQAIVARPSLTRGFLEVQVDAEPSRWDPAEVTRRALELADDAGRGPLLLVAYYARAAHPRTELSYDEFVRDVDAALRTLVEGLRARDVLDDGLLVVTAPHGRELSEHGGTGHAQTLFEEALRVPLLFNARELPAARVAHPVSLVDVEPTLRALLDVPAAAHPDGTPLFEGGAPSARTSAVIAELVLPERAVLRAAIDGDWKLVLRRDDDPEADPDAWESSPFASLGPAPSTVALELYDLAADPGERRPVEGDRPAREALHQALLDYDRACREHGAPLPTLHEYAALASGLGDIGYF